MSVSAILEAIFDGNNDPVIEKVVHALIVEIPEELSDCFEAEKRTRKFVSSGIPESCNDMTSSSEQLELESKVAKILDILNIECKPIEVYRMEKISSAASRPVKLV
ncbi:hypothetical protein V3C99_008194 [Haemonchus contortus]